MLLWSTPNPRAAPARRRAAAAAGLMVASLFARSAPAAALADGARAGLRLVAARPIARGAVLQPDDVALASTPGAPAPGVLDDPARALGREARYAIARGAPLREAALAAVTLVHRGDAVRIIARAPGLVVTAEGTAASDAAGGAGARAINARTGRVVSGRASAPGTIAIDP